MISFKKIYSAFLIFLYFLFFIIFYLYLYSNKIDYLLLSANLLVLSCILYTFLNLKYHIVSCIFYFTIFIFLLSYPTIDYINYGYLTYYPIYIYDFTIRLIMISTVSIFIGSWLSSKYYDKKNIPEYKYNDNFLKTIRIISFIGILVSYPAYLWINIEKALFKLKVGDYYVYFATFESKLPTIIHYIGYFCFVVLLIYLATKPKKLYANIVLFFYIVSNFVILITGTRNPFILSLIFAFLYYFIRNQKEKGKWIGKREKILISIISVPVVLVMGALNYIRDGEKINSSMSIMDLLLDFIYKQGTSFNVLAWGYLYGSDLPSREFRNYTFGSVIDYLYRGKFGNILFNSVDIPSSERLTLALESNSLAHNLSYLAYPQQYLAGHGIGDSYLMGNYIDYGYTGVIILGILLGFIFVWLLQKLYIGKIISSTIALAVFTEIFFTARGSYSGSFQYIFTLPFWFILILVLFITNLIKKNNTYLMRRK